MNNTTGGLYINGQWLSGMGEPLVSENPATGLPIWQGHAASLSEVEAAVSSAHTAFDAWSAFSLDQRSALLQAFVKNLEEQREDFALAIHQETGKPLWESLTEVAAMQGKLKITLQAYHARTGSHPQHWRGAATCLSHRPLGVFAVLGPFNFPGHLPNGHIMPALLAGNTLVFKPSELTPMVGEMMVQLWEQSGLPPGVLNLVQGGRHTGESLAAHADLNGLLFTGSAHTGKALHKQFGGRPDFMLALEMGGNNPLLVMDSHDVDAAAYTIIQSAFISAGQRCTCARRLILPRTKGNQLILNRLVEMSARLKIGSDDDCFIGPVISNTAADKLLNDRDRLLKNGARELLSMQRLQENRPFLSPGIIDVSEVAALQDEESFGPLLQVLWVEDFEAAIRAANATRFGLSAGLLSDSGELWQQFYTRSRAGIVNWNKPLPGASSAAPFGGTGASGNFRPSAYYAADYCAYPVASMMSEELALPENLSPGVML